jgi:hypothetical protein
MTEPKKKMFTARAAGIILAVFGKLCAKMDAEELGKKDFKISTQLLGVSFSEKLRNAFRSKWLRRV